MKCPICGGENVERVEVDDDIVDASFDESKTGSNDHRALFVAVKLGYTSPTDLALVGAAVRHLSDSGVDVDSLPLDRSLLDDIERVIFADDPESEADRIAQEHSDSDLAWSMVEP